MPGKRVLSGFLLGLVVVILNLEWAQPQEAGRKPAGGRKSPETKYRWTQLTAAAGYGKSYNFHLFSDDRNLHAFHHDGVYESSDGRTWTKTPLNDDRKSTRLNSS